MEETEYELICGIRRDIDELHKTMHEILNVLKDMRDNGNKLG